MPKGGAGRTVGYRITTLSHVEALRSTDGVVWETRRYGALYVVDRASLIEMMEVCIPVVHLGQVEAVKAVTSALPATQCVTVWLWCPRDVAVGRIAQRGTGDTTARLRAWDETEPLPEADIAMNTADVLPADAAVTIHSRVQAWRSENLEKPSSVRTFETADLRSGHRPR